MLDHGILKDPMGSTNLLNHQVPDIAPESLGDAAFRRDYGIRYAYLSGAMYKGIASKEMVVAMGKANLMSFLGTGGMNVKEIESSIHYIKEMLDQGQSFGMNLLSNYNHPEQEDQLVELYLVHGIRYVEAAAYINLSSALVRYRLTGIRRNSQGGIDTPNRIMAKVSRPEVAELFMRSAPEKMVDVLLKKGLISFEEAELSKEIPMAQDICVEADSGGHTDKGNAYVLMPAIATLRDTVMAEEGYDNRIRTGAAGGIGTPDAVVAAFMLGADFVLTGSINQCTVEAGNSDAAKDILQKINVQDTGYTPAGDMFELGAKVQVVKRGLFFPARANKLYDLYMRHKSISEIDEKTQLQIQQKYFKRSFEDVWLETKTYLNRTQPEKLAEIEASPKQKMAAIFRWYFIHTARLTMKGCEEQRMDYQIHCGPSLGAFNQWVKGTARENWRNRCVAEIGEYLMQQSAHLMSNRMAVIQAANNKIINNQQLITNI
jgi:trans-AT polyketide synthase/acyltransferase/oxidoreductase domain-containing protein